jgi:hypothetical protein
MMAWGISQPSHKQLDREFVLGFEQAIILINGRPRKKHPLARPCLLWHNAFRERVDYDPEV